MTFSMSRLIHKKWLPLEDIEARPEILHGTLFHPYTCCTKREVQSEKILKNWYSLIIMPISHHNLNIIV